MSEQKLKIAVFIDFDNIEIGVKTTLNLQFDIGAVLEAIKERGEVITKVAYGDWKRSGDHGRAMAQHAVRMVQRVMTPGGDKNGADINLALDALEMAFTHDHINAFVIVGGDSDFITLVEKLKQYDSKVFVVGGRAFTSQVMQKNCTEFIAYENVVRTPRQGRPPRGTARAARRRAATSRGSGTQSIEQAVPLVKRALKVLADREVSPQLGLLKSTLLQLDSSFSERDYGVSTFREFAEKLAQQGLVTLKHAGPQHARRVARAGDESAADSSSPLVEASLRAEDCSGGRARANAAQRNPRAAAIRARRRRDASLGDGVALVRRALAEADHAAAMADVSAPVQAVPEERAAGFRRAPLRIDRRSDARLPEGRPAASRARSPGRPARVRQQRGSRAHRAARLGPRGNRDNGSDARSARPRRRPEGVRSSIAEHRSAPVIDAQVTEVIEEAAAPSARRARKTTAGF